MLLIKNSNLKYICNRIILLDPNINKNTCFISKEFSKISSNNFQSILKSILKKFINKENFIDIENYINNINIKFKYRTNYINTLSKEVLIDFNNNNNNNNYIINSLQYIEKIYKNRIDFKIYFSNDLEAFKLINKNIIKNLFIEPTLTHFELIQPAYLDKILKSE
jgi:hypothetical protein